MDSLVNETPVSSVEDLIARIFVAAGMIRDMLGIFEKCKFFFQVVLCTRLNRFSDLIGNLEFLLKMNVEFTPRRSLREFHCCRGSVVSGDGHELVTAGLCIGATQKPPCGGADAR
ncbi:hypothetical protein TNCV_2577381 [Trichonephila clavipes]|nr:hypothetical protein TNCV_2577381 [Trichonephila clavipes]